MIAPFLLIFLVAVGAFFLLVLVVGLGLLGAGFEAMEKLPFLKREREASRADDERAVKGRLP